LVADQGLFFEWIEGETNARGLPLTTESSSAAHFVLPDLLDIPGRSGGLPSHGFSVCLSTIYDDGNEELSFPLSFFD
jgi:hypothetical protein